MRYFILLPFLSGCAMLGKKVSFLDDAGNEVVTTVGAVAADAVESTGSVVVPVLEGVATLWSANPVIGTGIGAAALMALAKLATLLRRKK